MIRHLLYPSLVCVTLAGCAAHRDVASARAPHPDERVRVVFASRDSAFRRPMRQSLIGDLVAADAHGVRLRVAPAPEPLAFPAAAVHAVYASGGRRSRLASALVRGGKGVAVGALTGLVFGAIAPHDEKLGRIVLDRAIGAGVAGVVLGIARPPELWQRTSYGVERSPPRPD